MSFFRKSNPQPHPVRSSQAAVDQIAWILPRRLAVGSRPTAARQPQLIQSGVRAIFSLCSEQEATLPIEIIQTFDCVRFVLPDSHSNQPLQVDQFAQAVEILHQLLQAHQSVYVHCLAGIERSPLVCIGYLYRYQQIEVWEALNLLKQIHPSTSPTPAQIKIVRELSK
jgi:atypical dual specificity phosphatase